MVVDRWRETTITRGSMSERIPAKCADFFWNDDPRLDYRAAGPDLVVIDSRPRAKGDTKVEYDCSLGAHCAGWMEDADPMSRPEGVFTNWLQGSTPDAI